MIKKKGEKMKFFKNYYDKEIAKKKTEKAQKQWQLNILVKKFQ